MKTEPLYTFVTPIKIQILRKNRLSTQSGLNNTSIIGQDMTGYLDWQLHQDCVKRKGVGPQSREPQDIL